MVVLRLFDGVIRWGLARGAVTVVPVTRIIRNIPVEVLLYKDEGLPSRSVVNVDDITTKPKTLIKGRIAVLSAERMQQIEDAIRFALDFR